MINSHNDWDQLRECFVGIADNMVHPKMDESVMSFSYAGYDRKEVSDLRGPYPKWIIDEANEDLNKLADCLIKLDIKVRRPSITNHSKTFSTPDWDSTGWYNYCPRDLLLPLDNLIIDCPSAMRSRYFETFAYRDFLYEQFEEGAQWISAPKPKLLDSLFTFEDLTKPTITDEEIIFDAANIVRLGNDLLYQVSNSGSLKGAKWLESIVNPLGYKVHLAEGFYAYTHFDSTVIPLKPGLVLFNGARLNKNHYPKLFEKWDKIFFDDIIDIGSSLPNGVSPCSPYIGLNLLSINEELVIVDVNQEPLRKKLSEHGIDSIGMNMRHARTISGGFHCVTLDTLREGKRESYF
tara:strand:- start:32 stop:1078 length:1047 start_codon:yes stop_codon:yes gene_type:complete